MKIRFLSIYALFFVTAVFAAGDHFPVAQGNSWLFSFVKSSGGWGTVITDSGTMEWRMQLVTNSSSGLSAAITVKRTYNHCRKIYRPGGRLPGGSEVAYDSVFSPPRVSVDSVTIISGNQDNGVTLQGDTCWSFVHDPQGSLPAGRLSVRDTAVSCMGKTASAVIIDQSPCRARFAEPVSYITVKDIGPVEYHLHSSPDLMDAFWAEDWKLISTNFTTPVKIQNTPRARSESPRLVRRGNNVILEGLVSAPGKLRGAFFKVNGAVLGSFETVVSSPGLQRILIPAAPFKAAAFASGPCIMKLVKPDGAELFATMTDF